MRIITLLLTIIITSQLGAQSKKEWFPSELNIQPFTANFLEPKAGFSYLLNESQIRLDIGTSADVYKITNDNSQLSFGVDLFTFTRLRSENNFKFPVETTDFYFGFNSGYKIIDKNKQYGFRFRFAHISAHLVDGSFNLGNNKWRNGRRPITFSREFFELIPFYQIDDFRIYTGVTYLFHTLPANISKGIYQFGFDKYFTSFPSKIFTPFIAYDFKLSKIDEYTGNNIVTGGVKFGTYNRKGFSISISYYSGKSVHGEFFNLNEDYFMLGFNMDL